MSFKTHGCPTTPMGMTAKLLYQYTQKLGRNPEPYKQNTNIISQMLNYHKILSQPAKTNAGLFKHFLTLGSHSTVVRIPPLISLSEVTLYPHSKFIINQNKLQQGIHHILIPLSGSLRIDEKVYEKWEVVFGGKFVNEIENKQTSFLYLQYEGGNQTDHPQSTKLAQNQQHLTDKLSAKHVILPSSQSLELNKRILLYIKSGRIKIASTNQYFQQGECLYTKKGCGQVQAISQTEILVFQLKDEQ